MKSFQINGKKITVSEAIGTGEKPEPGAVEGSDATAFGAEPHGDNRLHTITKE